MAILESLQEIVTALLGSLMTFYKYFKDNLKESLWVDIRAR